MKSSFVRSFFILIILLFFRFNLCFAYSSLTHLAVVDAAWEDILLPALKQKFPYATEEQLKQAKAFAYGGSVAPDLGYGRHGNKLFSNLVHYVRTGDFVTTLLQEAQDINEYALALGVLTHYYADAFGHSIGVNRSVPLMFPGMRIKFGDVVTYADDKLTHSRTEFSFDVVQAEKGNYVSKAYHDFIGFQISKPVLQRAFLKTYGIGIDELFGNFDKAVGSFRWIVKDLMPEITKQAWKSHKKDIKKLSPSITRHRYVYRMRRLDYFGEFGKVRAESSIRATVFSIIFRFAPKIGPLKRWKFKTPTQKAQLLFTESFDSTVIHYRAGVKRSEGLNPIFENTDWDTGKRTAQHEYSLADKTYSDWVIRLKEKDFITVNPPVKKNILSYYNGYIPDGTIGPLQWQLTTAALEELKNRK